MVLCRCLLTALSISWLQAYIVVWAAATEVFAIHITLNTNGDCKPWSTYTCFNGWPDHKLNMPQRW